MKANNKTPSARLELAGKNPVARHQTTATAQLKKLPAAPPAYKPQPVPKVLQTKKKAGHLSPPDRSPGDPPVLAAYRPQSVPKVLQRKKPSAPPPISPSGRAPKAPPVYRPAPMPGALQKKSAGHQQLTPGKSSQQPVGPPVYRPESKKIVQARMAPQINRVIQRAANLRGVWAVRAQQQAIRDATPEAIAAAALRRQQEEEAERLREEARAEAERQREEEEAAAAELAERQANAGRGWNIRPAAANHYNDGWGALYGIRDEETLKQRIRDAWDQNEGTDGSDIEIYLGQYTRDPNQPKGCNIVYRKEWDDDGDNGNGLWIAFVFHCGPGRGAG